MAAYSADNVDMNTACYTEPGQCVYGHGGIIDENPNADSCSRATSCNQCVNSYTDCFFDTRRNLCVNDQYKCQDPFSSYSCVQPGWASYCPY
jgi:hypothetical protein